MSAISAMAEQSVDLIERQKVRIAELAHIIQPLELWTMQSARFPELFPFSGLHGQASSSPAGPGVRAEEVCGLTGGV
jgi:hypothetical protein